jgi:rhodanese-related sulfurtransferase
MLVDSLTSPAQEISPNQDWTLLNEVPGTKLVDVRTIPEWLYVGVPDVQSTPGTLLQISWHIFPDMRTNETFAEELQRAASPNDVLIFVCQSGGRSLAAARAAAAAGFSRSYSLRGGFEGPVDDQGHRGSVAGWKFAGLPWNQQ